MPATRTPKKQTPREPVLRASEVLDVEMTAQFLTISSDTVYDLFKAGESRAESWAEVDYDTVCSAPVD
jgi:hypothetical protein